MSSLKYWLSQKYWFNQTIVIPLSWTLAQIARVIAPAIAAWFRWMYALLRLLSRQEFQPLLRRLPSLAESLGQLGKRYALRAQWFEEGEGISAFLTPGPGAGVKASLWAAEELAPWVVGFIAVVVVLSIVLKVVVPPILATWHNGAVNADVQREIFNRGGAYPGMPGDLGVNGSAEQNKALLNLNTPSARSAGAGGVGDQANDDLNALIDKPKPSLNKKASPSSSPSVSQSLPGQNSGGSYSVQTSDGNGLDDAALQIQRLKAIQGGVNGYNDLVQQHAHEIQSSGADPGSTGFYPGQKLKSK